MNHIYKSFNQFSFFRSVQDYAENVFPSNVVCRTGHSIAYGKFGARLDKNYLCLLKFLLY